MSQELIYNQDKKEIEAVTQEAILNQTKRTIGKEPSTEPKKKQGFNKITAEEILSRCWRWKKPKISFIGIAEAMGKEQR